MGRSGTGGNRPKSLISMMNTPPNQAVDLTASQRQLRRLARLASRLEAFPMAQGGFRLHQSVMDNNYM